MLAKRNPRPNRKIELYGFQNWLYSEASQSIRIICQYGRVIHTACPLSSALLNPSTKLTKLY